MIYIPVIGDVHGGLLLLEELLIRLQTQLQMRFPWILQVGDLGISQEKINYHSNWHRRNLPQINDLLAANHRIHKNLWRSKQVNANLLFVRGNHDELRAEFINSTTLAPVSDLGPQNAGQIPLAGSKLIFLPDGRPISLEIFPDIRIRISGLGGIDAPISRGNPANNGRIKEQIPGIGLDLSALKNLESGSQGPEIDVLLTHQGPAFRKKGSQTISDLVENLRPGVHFHGHSHEINLPQRQHIGQTPTVALGNLPHCPADNPEKMCWQILRYHIQDKKMEILEL